MQRTSAASASVGAGLNLPRVAWEGGPAYWNQFSVAAAAGWTNPSFFPILVDSDPFSGASEILHDKSLGITGYVGGLNEYTPWSLLAEHDMYYIGDRYNSFDDGMMPADFPNLVGYRLGDETDGLFDNPQDGYDFLNGLIAGYGNRSDGRFIYNNYTQQVVQQAWPAATHYLNDFTDAVSIDMYWYTIPDSSYTSHDPFMPSVGGPANPRSASSYGAMVRGMREKDAEDGKKQPTWMFVENLDGGPAEQYVRHITPGELKGAVMSSIINEARGILWFNSAMPAGDPQATGNVIRTAQYNPSWPGAPQVAAMGQVNNQVLSLATVLNTQSYVWAFGSGLETMLKAKDDFAYIFAMCAGGSTPGSRTFTLPPGIAGTNVIVVDESRNLTVSGGAFTDTFAAEYSYHIYKIAL